MSQTRRRKVTNVHWVLGAVDTVPANLFANELVDVEHQGDANADDAVHPNVSGQHIGWRARVGRGRGRVACRRSRRRLCGIAAGPQEQVQRMLVPFEDGHGEDGLPRWSAASPVENVEYCGWNHKGKGWMQHTARVDAGRKNMPIMAIT